MMNLSRFSKTPVVKDGNKERNYIRKNIDSTVHPTDIYHTVQATDRIDLLSYRYFGRSDLWWVIADYNMLFFPLVLEEGSILRIPSYEHLYMDLLGV
jgi:hypothetical protein